MPAQLDWDQLVNGLDYDLGEGEDLPVALRVAEFAPPIPEGEPVAFIDKNRRFFAYPEAQQNDEDRWYRVGDWTSGEVTGVDEVAAPVGEWVAFASTWLTKSRWEPTDTGTTTGSLYVEFLSLAMVRYDSITASMWSDMCRSKSKGQFVYWQIAFCNGNKKGDPPGWPYDLLRMPQRKVTESMRKANFTREFSHGPTSHLSVA